MKSIPANSVLLIVPVRKGIEIGLGRNSGVKRSVENRDLRLLFSKQFPAGKDCLELRSVMERSQLNQALDPVHYAFVNQDRLREQGTALSDAVPDCVDFIQTGKYFPFSLRQCRRDKFQRLRMVGKINLPLKNAAVSGLVLKGSSGGADSLADAARQNRFPVHLKQLIFERGAPRINDQYFH